MSRLVNLPVKYPELGRIRLGLQEEGKKYPTALDRFRFTTKDEEYAKAVSTVYGGDITRWRGEYEVITESESLDVLLPVDPIFAAYEMWGSGGNQRRCNGEDCIVPVTDPEGGHLESVPCICIQHDLMPGDKDACSVTVRLKVVLPRIPGFGIWLMTTGSIYAAMELPAQVQLIESIRLQQNINIPCDLVLEHRKEKRTYEKFERDYHVPVLRVRESVQRLMAQVSAPEPHRSLAPAKPELPSGAAAAPTPASSPGGAAPEAGRVESGQPEPPAPARKRGSWKREEVEQLCTDNGLSTAGSVADMITRLRNNGVIE